MTYWKEDLAAAARSLRTDAPDAAFYLADRCHVTSINGVPLPVPLDLQAGWYELRDGELLRLFDLPKKQ